MARRTSISSSRRARSRRGRLSSSTMAAGCWAEAGSKRHSKQRRARFRASPLLLAELRKIDLVAHLAFEELQPVFQVAHLLVQRVETNARVVARRGPWHLRIAELPLQGREHVQRLAAPAGA